MHILSAWIETIGVAGARLLLVLHGRRLVVCSDTSKCPEALAAFRRACLTSWVRYFEDTRMRDIRNGVYTPLATPDKPRGEDQ